MDQPHSIRKNKFVVEDNQYFDFIENLASKDINIKDAIFHFPLYVGHVNMARLLTFYEAYKHVVDISGDVADVGTWKGASLLTLAKLSVLLEPHSNTEVHAFDWFKGTETTGINGIGAEIVYHSSKSELEELIADQGLDDRVSVNELDLTLELESHLENRPWLRFKYVFMDCGIKSVLEKSLPIFWKRLSPGGVLMLDHYNHPSSPYESTIVQDLIEGRTVHQIPFSRSPTGFVIK